MERPWRVVANTLAERGPVPGWHRWCSTPSAEACWLGTLHGTRLRVDDGGGTMMDESRFDQIARSLAAPTSRRLLVGAGAATAGAALLGLLGNESEARRGNKSGRKRGKKA